MATNTKRRRNNKSTTLGLLADLRREFSIAAMRGMWDGDAGSLAERAQRLEDLSTFIVQGMRARAAQLHAEEAGR